MQQLIHGTDKGNAVILSLVLIIVLSLIFLSTVPRISAMDQHARIQKEMVIQVIEISNLEIMSRYDFR